MKVEIIVRKYKSAEGIDYVTGQQVDLPDAEAASAILHNVAKAIGESSPQPPAPAEPAYAEPRRGRSAKEE